MGFPVGVFPNKPMIFFGTSKACLDTRAILSTIAQAMKEQTSKSHLKQQKRWLNSKVSY